MGEKLYAYLDDVYAVTTHERAREVFDEISQCLLEYANVETNKGKCRAWSKNGGAPPPGIADIDSHLEYEQRVWRGDRPAVENGIKILGAPLGTTEYCKAFAENRIATERELWQWIKKIEDPQSAFLLLFYCAVPRANHLLRMLPPSISAEYAEMHDDGVFEVLGHILGSPVLTETEKLRIRKIASLPGHMGGLGLRDARRTAPAAYFAAWADALPMICERDPEFGNGLVLDLLRAEGGPVGDQSSCIAEAAQARVRLNRADYFPECPTWLQLQDGVRPPQIQNPEPGEWQRGWQFFASRACEKFHLQNSILPNLQQDQRAMLLSQSGRLASKVLTVPKGNRSGATEIRPEVFLAILRRRLRLPMQVDWHVCPANSCNARLDDRGDHLTSCMRTGRVRRRATALERALQRVCREAGGRVVPNRRLAHMRLNVPDHDQRNVEVACYGLPCYGGKPLMIDCTQVSVLGCDSTPHPRANVEPGICMERRVNDKMVRYPELVDADAAGLLKFLVLPCEVGGRWGDEWFSLIAWLAKSKARTAPKILRRSTEYAWTCRWWNMLAVAAQAGFGATLVDGYDADPEMRDGPIPTHSDVMGDARYVTGPDISRMPLRG